MVTRFGVKDTASAVKLPSVHAVDEYIKVLTPPEAKKLDPIRTTFWLVVKVTFIAISLLVVLLALKDLVLVELVPARSIILAHPGFAAIAAAFEDAAEAICCC